MVDEVWGKLATAMMCGELGSNVYMVKVSPRQDVPGVSRKQSKGDHVICVYNTDYRDTGQVMKVENIIRSIGVSTDLTYKPDIFSALGIYRNNEWGFRPTIYHSMVVDERSKIVVVGTSKWYYNTNRGLEYPYNRKEGLKKKVNVMVKEAVHGSRSKHLNENEGSCSKYGSSDSLGEVKKSMLEQDELGLKLNKSELSSEKKGRVLSQREAEDYEEDLDRYEVEGDDSLLLE